MFSVPFVCLSISNVKTAKLNFLKRVREVDHGEERAEIWSRSRSRSLKLRDHGLGDERLVRYLLGTIEEQTLLVF